MTVVLRPIIVVSLYTLNSSILVAAFPFWINGHDFISLPNDFFALKPANYDKGLKS